MKNLNYIMMVLLGLVFLSGCTEAQYASHVIKQIPMPGDKGQSTGYYKVGTPYKIAGQKYYPKENFQFSQTGIASWYGPQFHGKQTANGEIFDKNELTAAHKTLQMPSIIRVTNLNNGRSLILRVNDRGPYAHNRILDVSERAAELLGFKSAGTAKIKIEVLEGPSREVAAMARQRIDTTGYEVALNQNKIPQSRNVQIAQDDTYRSSSPTSQRSPSQYTAKKVLPPSSKPQFEPITRVALTPPNKPVTAAPMTITRDIEVVSLSAETLNNTAPAASQIPAPLTKPSEFYVQAGSFRDEQNALNFSNSLSQHGNSKVYLSRTDNISTFRVKLGPYSSNEDAVIALNNLQNAGKSGIIIAE